MLIEIISIVAPVFICAGLGYAWARAGRPFDSAFVGMLVADVGSPCLVFSTLTRLRPDPASLGEMAAASAACLAGCAAVAAMVLKITRLPFKAFLPALVFPNAGNIGMPICLFAFGDRGLALAIIFFSVASFSQFTLGVAVAMGKLSFRDLARVPLVYAAALALVVLIADVPVPRLVANTTRLIADLTIPLMLMALGVSLAKLHTASFRRAMALGSLRLLMGFAVALAVAAGFGLEEDMRRVLIVQGSGPVAVISYLIALRYGNSPDEVAGMVLTSTALSFITIPLVLALLL